MTSHPAPQTVGSDSGRLISLSVLVVMAGTAHGGDPVAGMRAALTLVSTARRTLYPRRLPHTHSARSWLSTRQQPSPSDQTGFSFQIHFDLLVDFSNQRFLLTADTLWLLPQSPSEGSGGQAHKAELRVCSSSPSVQPVSPSAAPAPHPGRPDDLALGDSSGKSRSAYPNAVRAQETQTQPRFTLSALLPFS